MKKPVQNRSMRPTSSMTKNALSEFPSANSTIPSITQRNVVPNSMKFVNRNIKKKSLKTSRAATPGGMRSISRLIRYRHISVSQTIVGSRISTNGRETIFQNSQSNRSAFMVGSVASRTEKSANKATLRYVARRVNANKGERQARLIHMGANITLITGLRHPTAKPLNNGGFYD